MGVIVFDYVSVKGWPPDSSFSVVSNFDMWTIFLKIEKFLRVDFGDPASLVLIDNPLDCPGRAFPGVKPTFESDNEERALQTGCLVPYDFGHDTTIAYSRRLWIIKCGCMGVLFCGWFSKQCSKG